MAGRLFGWPTQFLLLPRAPSVVSHFGGYINAQGYYPWVKICSTEISRLHLTLAELDFEYPTIKSLRALNNSAIVLKNSNHNNRQSLICDLGNVDLISSRIVKPIRSYIHMLICAIEIFKKTSDGFVAVAVVAA